MIRTFALTFCRCLDLITNPTPLPLTWLRHAQTLVHIGEYAWTLHALTPNTPIAPFDKAMWILCLLHPLAEVDFPPFIDDFHLEMEVILNWGTFTSTLTYSPRFFSDGPSSMVYELLQDYFVPNDFMNDFDLFKNMWAHCSRSCSTFNIVFVFYILTFNIWKTIWKHMSIAMNEVTDCLITRISIFNLGNFCIIV
jgi:hypothetical protein